MTGYHIVLPLMSYKGNNYCFQRSFLLLEKINKLMRRMPLSPPGPLRWYLYNWKVGEWRTWSFTVVLICFNGDFRATLHITCGHSVLLNSITGNESSFRIFRLDFIRGQRFIFISLRKRNTQKSEIDFLSVHETVLSVTCLLSALLNKQ